MMILEDHLDQNTTYNRNNNSRRQSNVSTSSARGPHQYKNKDKYGERKYYNTKDGMKRRDSYSRERDSAGIAVQLVIGLEILNLDIHQTTDMTNINHHTPENL